ncbi:MAG: glycosyltransferase family 4 protein [Anaerolinea sp.]|nr:glycosyltransferase family 4 protein [Anaerolinea sp.]
MKPRILYTAFDLVPSPKGASTHITYFVRGLVEAGLDVTLITAGDPSLPDQESYYGATLLRAPWGDDPHFLRRAVAFGRFVLAHIAAQPAYDLVHVRSIWSGFPLTQVKRPYGFKLLYEVNGLPSIEMKYHYPALSETAVIAKLQEQESATLHAADAIITPSQVTAAYLTSLRIPAAKITVIPNGFDTEQFTDDIRQASSVNRQAPIVLYVGTLADWQGLDVLLHALALVVAQQPCTLHIVGRGRKRQQKRLRKLAQKLGVEEHVTVATAVPHSHIPAIIAQADVCVAPLSYNDRNVVQGCCPIKILEYMAAGKPIVAANLPVARELVCADREALLFTPDDPEHLAQQLRTLLNDPHLARCLGEQAANRARREFTWSLAQSRLLAVYQDLDVSSAATTATDSSYVASRLPA